MQLPCQPPTTLKGKVVGGQELKQEINGLQINYKIAGSGPAILILHGWGSSLKSWLRVQEFLTARGYKVIIPDLPGFGKSDPPSLSWTIDDYIEWLKNFVQKINEIQPKPIKQFFLLGHSFGGRIAIKFAVKYPEKLSSLILYGAAGITPRPKIRITIFSFISQIGNLIFSFPLLKPFRNLAKKFIYFFAQTKDYQFIQAPTLKGTFKKTIKENLTSYLNQIEVPTLIIWGKNDKITPLKDAYLIKKEIKNSTLEIIPDLGHSINLQAPEKLAETIFNWFKKVESQSSQSVRERFSN